jgi:hypothetical protein
MEVTVCYTRLLETGIIAHRMKQQVDSLLELKHADFHLELMPAVEWEDQRAQSVSVLCPRRWGKVVLRDRREMMHFTLQTVRTGPALSIPVNLCVNGAITHSIGGN